MAAYCPAPANAGRGLTLDERADIADAFGRCVPEGSRAALLSRHGLSCAMISLLGYKPATVRARHRLGHRAVSASRRPAALPQLA